MAQKALRRSGKQKSAGALRKHQGKSKAKTTFTKRRRSVRDGATANYAVGVEAAMASRVPSDQRSKLAVVKSGGLQVEKKKKNMKKPLTRGRKRKSAKKE